MIPLVHILRHKFSINSVMTLFVMFCFLFLCCLPTPHHACQELDRLPLLSFSQNLTTPLNWSSSSDCCFWEGIHCDNTGWVTNVTLPYLGLEGPISLSLANLTHLSFLNLSHNFLSGSVPSSFLSSFGQLQTLDLSYNKLSGELPASPLPNRPLSLQFIDLSSNQFVGDFQLSFLGQASNLSTLDISNNSFTGIIPSSICENYSMITYLGFCMNEFNLEIPLGLGKCLKLEVFQAGWNRLTGPLPNDIYDITSLQQLSVPFNNISGNIDGATQIVQLINLAILDLSFNEIRGGLPQEIGKLTNLKQLLLGNNLLNGSLPPSLTNCTNLRVLSLRVNEFNGKLSDIDFSKFSQLNILDLGVNNFTGYLPSSIYSCLSLTAVRFTKNQLEGQIQPDILALKNLSYFGASINRLTNITGAFQILTQSPKLTKLLLSENFFGEAIPVDIDGFQNLQVLGIGGCQLTGQVPNWLVNLKKLGVLDLSSNQFTGSIPRWLGSMPSLFYMDLSSNCLTGEFPLELTRLPTLLSSAPLDQVNLELPLVIVNPTFGGQFFNQLSGLHPALYLRNNSINGSIPAEIGRMHNLQVLDLSLNNFSGVIPVQLANLTNLETLDLSGNNLTGEIPPSLVSLSFLSWFSVANNNLVGPIPTTGQFDTFPVSSFVGNPGLCGRAINRRCQNQNEVTTISPASNKHRHLVAVLVLCIGCGCLFIALLLWIISSRIKVREEGSDKIGVEPRLDKQGQTDYHSPSGKPCPGWYPNMVV